jgi:hypothetical protein
VTGEQDRRNLNEEVHNIYSLSIGISDQRGQGGGGHVVCMGNVRSECKILVV